MNSPEIDADLALFLDRLPKTETHLHLEGAIPWKLLREFDAVRFGDEPVFFHPEFRYADFGHFNRVILDHAVAWFTSAENYARVARIVFAGLVKQNVKYLETSVHLGAIAHLPESGPEALAAIRAEIPAGLEVRIFLGMCRDDYGRMGAKIEEALDWEGLDGIDLHGVETLPLEAWTDDVWRRAREKGKFTKAHAGEFGPAAHVREVVERLGVDRIEHGVRAADDPEVVAFLIDRGVTLDVCPVSNLKLQVAPSIQAHPIAQLHAAGVRCTVNSDDPFFFGTTLSNEYAVLAREGGFSRRELARLARNGFDIALLPEAARAQWRAEIDALIGEL